MRLSGFLFDFDLFVDKLFVGFVGPGKLKRIGEHRFSLFHAGDHVGATEPVGFGEISLRPLGGMIGMRVIEADNIFSTLAALTLNADQFAGIDIVTVLRGIGTRIAATSGRRNDADAIILRTSEQYAAAFMRIGFLAVTAEGGVVCAC
jgi:hypothetical protein